MKIATIFKKGVLIVRVEGELDMHSAHEFRQTIDDALDSNEAKHIVLNFNGVDFIDSSGLGVILGRYKRVSLLKGQMVATHIQPQVARIFELAGLYKIIKVCNNETEALAFL
ncbi:Anti-sigma F factor antagonist [bioreactor metagenome]|uniref:Anti-sigma F factor antagonist n=1 Tax=bioreactor metagenome TaxID=1076179 RepID=A0A644T0F7_9ZZZZ|nr:anti-sigma F factor antagonist [Negativicutes bacterium]